MMDTLKDGSSPLGDDKSLVQYRTHMGSDLMVVNAARVSLNKESDWERVRVPVYVDRNNDYGDEPDFVMVEQLSKRDQRLIYFLARGMRESEYRRALERLAEAATVDEVVQALKTLNANKHWTPFGHPQVQFRITMPIAIARQWFKSEVGFVRNEVSRRYVDDPPEIFVPSVFHTKPEDVKQGSGGPHIRSQSWKLSAHAHESRSYSLYTDMIEDGVAPEDARFQLPQGTYTTFIETGSLAAYARICGLRKDPHAQKEARHYAHAVSATMASLFPVSWDALVGTDG